MASATTPGHSPGLKTNTVRNAQTGGGTDRAISRKNRATSATDARATEAGDRSGANERLETNATMDASDHAAASDSTASTIVSRLSPISPPNPPSPSCGGQACSPSSRPSVLARLDHSDEM